MIILYKIYNSLITCHLGRENIFILLVKDFINHVIYNITAVLSEIARYLRIRKYSESKRKAF